MKLVSRLWGYIQYLLFGRYISVLVEDTPETLKSRVVYLSSDEGQEWLAVFLCPCGCAAKIHLNLLPESRPCWRVMMGKYTLPTVAPSVWRTSGCGSHFFIRNGCISWAK